jgi:hypothetical protein
MDKEQVNVAVVLQTSVHYAYGSNLGLPTRFTVCNFPPLPSVTNIMTYKNSASFQMCSYSTPTVMFLSLLSLENPKERHKNER